MFLLERILDVVFPPRRLETLSREATYETVAALIRPRYENGITSLLPYRNPLVRALIQEAKYHGSTHAQTILGTVLSDYLLEFLADEGLQAGPAFALVPVPLSKKRIKERGYNQVERMCTHTAQRVGLPLLKGCVTRVRDTLPQTTLRREARLQNVAGAFSATVDDPSIAYLVIDDVVTTGATLTEAVTTLRNHGAQKTYAIALAR